MTNKLLFVAIMALLIVNVVLADPPVNWKAFPPPTSWCVMAPDKGECFRQFSCGFTRFMYACGVSKCNSYGDPVCDDGRSSTYDWCQNPGKKATCSDPVQAACVYTNCAPYTHDADDNPSNGCEAQLFNYKVDFNQTYAKILAGDPAAALLTITRTDTLGNPAEVAVTPTVVPGGIAADTVIVELKDPITGLTKLSCKPNNQCSILTNFKTDFAFSKPGLTAYTINVVANGADKSHGATIPFKLDVVGCNFNKVCTLPEREERCPFDCALNVCAKTIAVTEISKLPNASSERGGRVDFEVTVNTTDCGKRDVELYLKKPPPSDWGFSFDCSDCPTCNCPTPTGKILKIKDAVGVQKVKLRFDIPKSATKGKYDMVVGIR